MLTMKFVISYKKSNREILFKKSIKTNLILIIANQIFNNIYIIDNF